MIITTQEKVSNRNITNVLGVVSGQSIRARHVGKDILALFRNLVGGEITEYSKLMAESREQAMDRMKLRAEELNADAIVGVRFTTSMLQAGASEIFIYGTAVKLG
ncbi:MAG TPA: YbjQ family protein [Candidatus Marinimicrobia bacterium]|nr:YbjQ family protein [Candidatus Neomarinimicrobiota bacterium]|tara:strand:+ start:5992 stop:6306 length:315 start_codon:yes stop_codon:yes gene_type:complete